ncbi:MAG TPA: hypothetical protein VF807_02645 [Ktedonobacterales bacterium]
MRARRKDLRRQMTGSHKHVIVARLPRQSRMVIPVIALSMLVPALLLGPLGYWLAREHALTAASDRVTHEASIAAAMITPPGASIVATGNTLMLATATQRIPLSNSQADLGQVEVASGDHLTLYLIQAGTLGVSNPGSPSMHLVADGVPAPQAAEASLLAECATSAQACRQTWHGTLTQQGTAYVAAYAPLVDQDGALAAALAVVSPEAAIERDARTEGMLFGGSAAAISGLVALLGWWLFMRRSDVALSQLGGEVRRMRGMAHVIEHRVTAQRVASRRHEHLAQEVVAGAHHLHRAVTALNETHETLRRSAGSLWSDISQPGSSTDPEQTVRSARDAVMATARLGNALDDTRAACDHVLGLMNSVIAESRAQAHAINETAEHTAQLAKQISEPRSPRSRPSSLRQG